MTGTPSKQEIIKEESRNLRGEILKDLKSENVAVKEETYELLKFHGTYEGYDRDTATERKKQGLDKEYEFMVRLKLPAGRLSAEQYLGLDKIAEKYANGTLRITTRQTFQMHCITKRNLWDTIHEVNQQLIVTLGGCGDVVRNVICSAAPINDIVHRRLVSDTYRIAKHFTPKTKAYHEIWVEGKDVTEVDSSEEEPIYGLHYMPRKFKIGLVVPEDNVIDVLTHDLAIILIFEGEELKGYNICMGGGLGMNHNQPETYPRLATPIAFVGPDDLIAAAEAVVKIQRDFGDRSNRKHARLKYVVEERGLEWTRKTFEEYFGRPAKDPIPIKEYKMVNHMGWHDQKDGKFYLGIPISSGRIVDRGSEKIRTGLRTVTEKYKMNLTLTADQNIILCDILPEQKNEITSMLRNFGIKLKEDLTPVYLNFLACVALPTCGKALSEAERVKLPLVADIEKVMEKNGIINEKIAIRIAGCPNGCSRPYVGDIGIVGRMPGHYVLFIGGDFEGTRLNKSVFDKVPLEHIPAALDPMFRLYKDAKNQHEGFGDFCYRYGIDKVKEAAKSVLASQYKWAA